ncbi:hypothetical protein LCGC14_0290690 [marine sediment metagenome]|uniref:Uncharacterized protein n=1 Tax=marine sediment metagenome TaxID=412755 RepID=A0A0F9TT83_9ZZZZ
MLYLNSFCTPKIFVYKLLYTSLNLFEALVNNTINFRFKLKTPPNYDFHITTSKN